MTNRLAYLAALACLALVPLAGCGGSGDGAFVEEPMRVLQQGDQWVMTGTRTGGVNTSWTDTVTVTTGTLNGQNTPLLRHSVQMNGGGAPIVDGDFFNQSGNRNLVQIGELDDDGNAHATTSTVMMPGQLQIGQTWTVSHDEDGDMHTTTYTVLGFEELATPIGTHTAAKLSVNTVAENSAHTATGTAWFEPGLGYFLKTVMTHRENEVDIVTTETISSTNVAHAED